MVRRIDTSFRVGISMNQRVSALFVEEPYIENCYGTPFSLR